jgi:hypothetical protein
MSEENMYLDGLGELSDALMNGMHTISCAAIDVNVERHHFVQDSRTELCSRLSQ